MDINLGLFLSEYSSEPSIHQKCVNEFQMLARGILNTLAFNSSVDKGSLWAILNATRE